MFYRKIRDAKPIMNSHLKVSVSKLKNPTNQQKIIHDEHQVDRPKIQLGKTQCQQILDQFHRGDRVRVQDPHTKRWDIEAVITSSSRSNRSSHLETDEGFSMWRN